MLITTHSSVLISDEFPNQKLFRVEKNDHKTNITPITNFEKREVVYELLGGSLSDLLLPYNFLSVEGTSDKKFIDLIISRFYSEKNIQIVPVWGDIEKTDRVLDYLCSAYAPFGKSLYQNKVVILLDKISDKRQNAFKDFNDKYPYIDKERQIVELEFSSIEEYYPDTTENQAGGHGQAKKWTSLKKWEAFKFDFLLVASFKRLKLLSTKSQFLNLK